MDRLGYAITPQFAPPARLRNCAERVELAARYPDVWIQSHGREPDEIRWARELFPRSRSYLGVYDDFGLMRERAVYAHCIHFDDDDRALMRDTGAVAAVSPTSNLSGQRVLTTRALTGWDLATAWPVTWAGHQLQPFHTMMAAYYVGAKGRPSLA